jgi:hypothetical protein
VPGTEITNNASLQATPAVGGTQEIIARHWLQTGCHDYRIHRIFVIESKYTLTIKSEAIRKQKGGLGKVISEGADYI